MTPATVTATLTPSDSGTVVHIDTDLNVTGKVAQFGRGVMADVSSKLLGQFAQNLERDVLEYGIEVTIPASDYKQVVARLSARDDPADVIHQHIRDTLQTWISAHCTAHPGPTLRERIAAAALG